MKPAPLATDVPIGGEYLLSAREVGPLRPRYGPSGEPDSPLGRAPFVVTEQRLVFGQEDQVLDSQVEPPQKEQLGQALMDSVSCEDLGGDRPRRLPQFARQLESHSQPQFAEPRLLGRLQNGFRFNPVADSQMIGDTPRDTLLK